MKTVAIIQARTGSTRLPGKVLKDLGGQTVLARVVARLRRVRLIGELLVATSDSPADDALVTECGNCSVAFYRGDENDVLDRYYQAAKMARADVVVRITSDCPLIDPEIADKTIAVFMKVRPDYASNALVRTYPRGLDTEVMSIEALSRAWQEARNPHEREHVTPYIYEHPDKFKILPVTGDEDYSRQRWTLDTPEDLEFVRSIYARFPGDAAFSWCDVLQLVEREPELLKINAAVMQKALHQG
ncbi:MAG: cytidylyltransferase domain-containing protein [Candidatus Sulfotelmatobacter sp.]